jgi:Na+-translocating ferredoxin:NAD+ oxidoreductase RnfG subunit
MTWYTLLPAALAVPALTAPAYAVVYLSIDQAQKAAFQDAASFAEHPITLTSQQKQQIKAKSAMATKSDTQRLWEARSSTGERLGWLIIDRVYGKHEFITYALALDAAGLIKRVEIMEYLESYGGEIRDPRWRAQFAGKRLGDAVTLDKDIKNISGATLSCRHVTDGVRRLLALHDVVLKGR